MYGEVLTCPAISPERIGAGMLTIVFGNDPGQA
jgi:hypothetical protein